MSVQTRRWLLENWKIPLNNCEGAINKSVMKSQLCRLWRPKFLAKSTERLHHEVAPSAILRLGKCYFFLLSHSSRRYLHSLSVPATQENNSPSVWR